MDYYFFSIILSNKNFYNNILLYNKIFIIFVKYDIYYLIKIEVMVIIKSSIN